MLKGYRSRYDRGVTCACCGRKLDPSDSYTLYPDRQDKAICLDCDKDEWVENQIESMKEI